MITLQIGTGRYIYIGLGAIGKAYNVDAKGIIKVLQFSIIIIFIFHFSCSQFDDIATAQLAMDVFFRRFSSLWTRQH